MPVFAYDGDNRVVSESLHLRVHDIRLHYEPAYDFFLEVSQIAGLAFEFGVIRMRWIVLHIFLY